MHYLSNITTRIANDMARLTAASGMNTADVTAYWRELNQPDGGPFAPEPDPLLVSAQDPEQWEESTHEFKALVHYVDHSSSMYAAHKEVATGDVIIDYQDQGIAFQEKSNIRFLINGSYYVPKKIGKALRDSWDLHAATRTLLLTLQP